MGRGYGARSERVLGKDELKLLLLSLFDGQERHGYELIRKIKSKSGGAYAPSPGMVYPTLAAMAEEGLVAQSSEEAGRKSYTLKEPGQTLLTDSGETVQDILSRLEALSLQDEQLHAPIQRALSNLEMVLADATADADADRVDQIVTMIDDTARQIERLG